MFGLSGTLLVSTLVALLLVYCFLSHVLVWNPAFVLEKMWIVAMDIPPFSACSQQGPLPPWFFLTLAAATSSYTAALCSHFLSRRLLCPTWLASSFYGLGPIFQYLTSPVIRNTGDIRSHIYDPTLIGEAISKSLEKNQNGRCFNRGKQGHL